VPTSNETRATGGMGKGVGQRGVEAGLGAQLQC